MPFDETMYVPSQLNPVAGKGVDQNECPTVGNHSSHGTVSFDQAHGLIADGTTVTQVGGKQAHEHAGRVGDARD